MAASAARAHMARNLNHVILFGTFVPECRRDPVASRVAGEWATNSILEGSR